MLRRTLLACMMALGLLGQGVAAAAALVPQEVHFSSLDGTDLKAWLFLPSALADAKATGGAVIALHGCGGLYATTGARQGLFNARHQAMAELLVSQGYAAIFPDSLTPRGVAEICTQRNGSRSITQTERRRDVLATLDWVRQQAWAKPDKVALLGWSHGGSAVLSATDGHNAEVQRHQAAGARFATAIAFYPGCSAALKSGYVQTTPLTMMVGELDDWTPAAPCITLGQQLKAEVNVFPNSYHDFDNPQGRVRLRTDVPNGVHPGQGVHAGPNPEAREKAYARVGEILGGVLGR